MDGPDEVLFGRIVSVSVDDAGNLVVADGQARAIRIFDGDGAYLRTMGGPGEGPGEFGSLAGAWHAKEGTVVAADPMLDRITSFGSDGEERTATLHAPGDRATLRPVRLAGPNAFLSFVESLPSVRDRLTRGGATMESLLEPYSDPSGGRSQHLIRHDLEGAVIDTVAVVPAMAMVVSSQGSGASITLEIMRVPFSSSPSATASREGHLAVTGGRSYELFLYDLSGALGSIVRLEQTPPLRTRAQLEALVRRPARGGEPMDDVQFQAAMRRYEDMPLPDRLPAWTSLLFADNGDVWAERFKVPGAEIVRWDVFGSDGGFLGAVAVPAKLRVQQVGEGKLAAVATDDLGVERVEVYELR